MSRLLLLRVMIIPQGRGETFLKTVQASETDFCRTPVGKKHQDRPSGQPKAGRRADCWTVFCDFPTRIRPKSCPGTRFPDWRSLILGSFPAQPGPGGARERPRPGPGSIRTDCQPGRPILSSFREVFGLGFRRRFFQASLAEAIYIYIERERERERVRERDVI
jgi:hypothetical protein